MEVWKTLAAPLIVAILGGIVVGIIIGRFNRPETPNIFAESQYIDLPNPLYGLSDSSAGEIEKTAQATFGKTDIKRFIDKTRYDKNLRITKLELTNSGEVRSQEIEISGNSEAAFLSFGTSNDPFSSKIKIKSLDPNASAIVAGLNGMVTSYFPPPILVLQGGKKVDVSSKNIPDSIYDYPPYVPILGILAVISTLFMIIAVPIAIVSSYSLKFKAAMTSKQEVAKLLKLLDYMKEKQPEKFQS